MSVCVRAAIRSVPMHGTIEYVFQVHPDGISGFHPISLVVVFGSSFFAAASVHMNTYKVMPVCLCRYYLPFVYSYPFSVL